MTVPTSHQVDEANAIDYLDGGTVQWLITSLPDAAEMGMTPKEWRPVFRQFAAAVFRALMRDGIAVFYQTDRRHDGVIEDKAHIVTSVAEELGFHTIWHKIAAHSLSPHMRRPSYSHLLAYSLTHTAGSPTPDVWLAGPRAYPDATDEVSLEVALDFFEARGARPGDALLDPFCGRGSIPYAAALRGFDTFSVDIDPKQVMATRARMETVPGGRVI